ncbi:MAG: flagellar hook-associated protein FlgK [Homoserinimonas sp.]|nr:flagellar hook-associated protein FlgK [Homoserinimonas sp.]
MSTFSGLNTAYTALSAARKGLDVIGQNIANATTEGYTRQRVATSAVGALSTVGPLSGQPTVGQGVAVDSIARLGNAYLDQRVRLTAATAGNTAVRANVMSALEISLQEPGENGLSTQLADFWSAWQDVSNQPGELAPTAVLLEQAGSVVAQISSGYKDLQSQWTGLRNQAAGMVAELNSAGAQVAQLNAQIRTTLANGGSVNELLDQRNNFTTAIAALTGATVRNLDDGSAEVLVGGNALVSGDTFRPVALAAGTELGHQVTLEWSHRPGVSLGLVSGELAGALAMLAPADGAKTGGAIAEAAAAYNVLATNLADQVNAQHRLGFTTAGAAGGDFFRAGVTGPAATTLRVIPTSASEIASSSGGALGGGNADAISQIGAGTSSPDNLWASFVTTIGVAARTELRQAEYAEMAATSASNTQLSNASVDLDEENVNMLTYQVAYQGAARVMTAVDEMLDTLINRTGLVGR